MQNHYTTSRLTLNKLSLTDDEFILELINTPEWIKFIGNRNVKTKEETKEYIQKIMNNPNINYWVVKMKDQKIPIGIITFIKRDYLEHHDIGFAFLEKHTKKGYAHEATLAVLNDATQGASHTHILATTVKENRNSIQLLEKLGLRFYKEIKNENDVLLVYAVASDELLHLR